MNPSFRCAIIGCGAISPTHADALLRSGQKIVALCDVIPARADALKEKFGLGDVPVYTDYPLLLDRERPDAVHICTPHDLHAPMSAEALRRGIHVLCEKPAGISEADLALLRDAQKDSRAVYGTVLQNRYQPNVLRLCELARGAGVASALGTVAWRRDADYYASGDWRGTRAHEGGGVMINQALHTLDLLAWICGEPAFVTAHVFNDHLSGVTEVEDTAVALFETADGTRLNFFATTAAGSDLPVELQVSLKTGEKIVCQNGTFAVNGKVLPSAPDAPAGKEVWGTCHRALIADFYRCIAGGLPFPIGLDEGSRVVRLILGMYASDGRRIPVGIRNREEKPI